MDHKQIDVLQAKLKHLFTNHPAEVGETYLQHFSFTLKTSLRLLWSGFILFCMVFSHFSLRILQAILSRSYTFCLNHAFPKTDAKRLRENITYKSILLL